MAPSRDRLVTALLDRHGRTYAEEAGIRLADKPAPLYQLLVLTTLLSARISADVAVAAARELFRAGHRTPERMREASWQDRVDALGRGHYRRYDERTATMLGEEATEVLDRWGGDLRRLHAQAGGGAEQVHALLVGFTGIGPVGGDIFLREAQGVWPDVAPFIDDRVRSCARELGLPSSDKGLAALTHGAGDQLRLISGLVRVGLDSKVADDVRAAARQGG